MRAYNSCQELGDPVPVLRLLVLDVKLKVLTVRNKVLIVRNAYGRFLQMKILNVRNKVLNVRHMYIYNTYKINKLNVLNWRLTVLNMY